MATEPFDPDQNPVRANRGIVVVVIALGLLLIVGMGGLLYGIVAQVGKPEEGTARAPASLPPTASNPEIGQAVRGLTAVADRLYLHIILPDGREVVRAYGEDGRLIYEIDPTTPTASEAGEN